MPSERFMPDANTSRGGAIGGYSSADAIGTDNPTLIVARFDPTTGRMLVDVNGASLVSDGDAVSATNDGYLILGTDGTNYQVVSTDSSGHLQVDVLTLPAGGSGLTDAELRATPVVVDLGANNDVTVTSGTITANLGAVDNAVLDDIAADTEAIKTSLAGTITVTGGGGGVEYTEGDTDATIVGSAVMMEVAADTLQPIQGTVAGGLLVNLGSNNDVTVTGTVDLGATDNAVLDTIDAVLDTINAKLVTGTDIGDVTINNASGASAVNIQDGGNTITVDGSLTVDLGANNDVTVTSGTITAVTAITNALPAGTNNIGDVDIATMPATYAEDSPHTTADLGVFALGVRNDSGSNFGGSNGDYAPIAVTAAGYVRSDIATALPAGTNAIGKLAANSGVDIGDVDVTSISAGTNLVGDVGIQPRTTNGLDTFMASGSDGSTILVATSQAVKASAGKVYGYYLYNPEAAVTFVHFYNTASASVTVGTTSPLFTLAIPAGSAANLMSEIGTTFGTAIAIAATTTAGGNTAPATGVSAVVWFK